MAASDAQRIKNLYRGLSDAWFGGKEAAMEYVAQYNHPDMGITIADFLACYSDAPDGYAEEWLIDGASFERDDSWVVPDVEAAGGLAGQTPSGRIYIFRVEVVSSAPGFPTETEPSEVHAAVLDDEAHFFLGRC